jgi:hypothetical protein
MFLLLDQMRKAALTRSYEVSAIKVNLAAGSGMGQVRVSSTAIVGWVFAFLPAANLQRCNACE